VVGTLALARQLLDDYYGGLHMHVRKVVGLVITRVSFGNSKFGVWFVVS
jgi:hypothetical protein